jgi:antitoxin MazE
MQVSKWGNSLALRLPATVVAALGLKDGDEIEVVIDNDRRFRISRDRRREKAASRIKTLSRPLPKGFMFDRDAANSR